MSSDDLTTLLREHVTHDEPHLPLPAGAIREGRRRVRRRRLAVGATTLAALAVGGALALPVITGSDDDGGTTTAVDPAAAAALEDYDARRMPEIMDEHVRRVLERSIPDPGRSTFTATDAQRQELPERYWDKASGLSVAFGEGEDHQVGVMISHARGEAEGDPERYCESGLEDGYYLTCSVERSASGDVVISKVSAVKPLGELRGGDWMAVDADQVGTIALDRLWWVRSVKVIKSETLLTYVDNVVKAVDRDPEGSFLVPVGDLVEIGLDPALVMPPPPPGDDGCPAWTMESKDFDVSCS
ncbi:hypothetical protein ACFP3Q_10900 [Nocardioides sp. GCM10027113]|uniref:hypothetical protein n=1 Tax=unclassified Nocardioides TaxID=2615069 RepID=UPI00360B8849